jgi:hypothetical protein
MILVLRFATRILPAQAAGEPYVRQEKMMEMDELVTEAALDNLEREIHLRRIVTEPAYAYYSRGGIVPVTAKILLMCMFAWIAIKSDITLLTMTLFAMAMTGLLESARQRERFDALVKLMDIEKNKAEANKASEPTSG